MRPAGPTRFERAAGFAAWAFPFAIALCRASSHAQWRGDVAAVRDIALGGIGWGGGLSTSLTQIALFIPLGTVTFRAALVSCLALAVAGSALFGIALRMLRAVETATGAEPSRYAAPLLGAIASLLATMTPAFQSEATIGGGVMLAVALGFFVANRVLSAIDRGPGDLPHRGLVALGFVLGAVTAENAVVGACGAISMAVVALFGRAHDRRRWLIPLRVARSASLAALVGLAVFSLPGLLRAMAPRAEIDFGGPYLWGSLLPNTQLVRTDLFAAWTNELGWSAMAMACLGTVTLALTARTRWWLAAPLVAIAGDLLVRRTLGETDGAIGLRLAALGWTACVATVGVHAFFSLLMRARIPLARPAASLVVAFFATVVALTVEYATDVADRAKAFGAEEYTDLALDRLPPQSAVVVGDPRTTWRLLSATLIEGRRPDVLVITRSLLSRGDTATRMLVHEPTTEPLLRAVALTGTTDEFSLSEIATTRPLFVELERGWTAAEYAHLTVDGVLLRFEPEPLVSSDRKGDVDRTLKRLARLFASIEDASGDADSSAVTRTLLEAQAKALLKSGDTNNANTYLAAVDRPEARFTVSGSVQMTFAATFAHMPANRMREEKAKERAKVRDTERKAEKKKEGRKR
ncbi:MAG: hypothetical protein HOW73_36080 [Polyangiaceae bacterium]|nr:hypothetical protein [Polyangiaceae bacterium]